MGSNGSSSPAPDDWTGGCNSAVVFTDPGSDGDDESMGLDMGEGGESIITSSAHRVHLGFPCTLESRHPHTLWVTNLIQNNDHKESQQEHIVNNYIHL